MEQADTHGPAAASLAEIAASLAGRERTANTRRTYANAFRSLVAFLGPEAGPESVNAASVHAWRSDLERAGRRPATVAVYLSAVRKLADHLGTGPAVRAVQGARNAGIAADPPQVLMPLELARLLARPDRRTPVGSRDLAVLLLSARAGLRAAETVALTRSAVEEHRQQPDRRLRRAVSRSTPYAVRVRGPRGRERTVPLAADVLPALAAWRDVRPAAETDALFVSLPSVVGRTPRPLDQRDVGRIVARYGAAAGLPPDLRGVDVLRNTFAAALHQNGAGLETMAELLGHTDLRTTRLHAPPRDAAPEPGDEDPAGGGSPLDRL